MNTEKLILNVLHGKLKKIEWSMGHGQCPTCCGNRPNKGWWTDTVGHKKNCDLAIAIGKTGKPVVWERSNIKGKGVKQMKEMWGGK